MFMPLASGLVLELLPFLAFMLMTWRLFLVAMGILEALHAQRGRNRRHTEEFIASIELIYQQHRLNIHIKLCKEKSMKPIADWGPNKCSRR